MPMLQLPRRVDGIGIDRCRAGPQYAKNRHGAGISNGITAIRPSALAAPSIRVASKVRNHRGRCGETGAFV